MYIFIYIRLLKIHCKGHKNVENNGTAVKWLKNVYITACDSVSESEAKSLLVVTNCKFAQTLRVQTSDARVPV